MLFTLHAEIINSENNCHIYIYIYIYILCLSVPMKQNYRQRKPRKRPFLESKPENFVYFQSKNLLQKDDAPKQNENTIASRYNGNPISLIKSNKNSGNANHRRRNFFERKPEI